MFHRLFFSRTLSPAPGLQDIKCQKTSRKIKLIKRRLFLKQEDFQTSFSNTPMKKSRNVRKIKLIKRRLYKVKEDVLDKQKSIRKRKVSCKILKQKKQSWASQKMKATMTPLVWDVFEAVSVEQLACLERKCLNKKITPKKTKGNQKDFEWIGDGVDGGKKKIFYQGAFLVEDKRIPSKRHVDLLCGGLPCHGFSIMNNLIAVYLRGMEETSRLMRLCHHLIWGLLGLLGLLSWLLRSGGRTSRMMAYWWASTLVEAKVR